MSFARFLFWNNCIVNALLFCLSVNASNPIATVGTRMLTPGVLKTIALNTAKICLRNTGQVVLADVIGSAGVIICPEVIKNGFKSCAETTINKFYPQLPEEEQEEWKNRISDIVPALLTTGVSYTVAPFIGMQQRNIIGLALSSYISHAMSAQYEEKIDILSKVRMPEYYVEMIGTISIAAGIDIFPRILFGIAEKIVQSALRLNDGSDSLEGCVEMLPLLALENYLWRPELDQDAMVQKIRLQKWLVRILYALTVIAGKYCFYRIKPEYGLRGNTFLFSLLYFATFSSISKEYKVYEYHTGFSPLLIGMAFSLLYVYKSALYKQWLKSNPQPSFMPYLT